MHVLRHGAGVAGNHEISNVQGEISTGKLSSDTMGEARRETERVRRMRRRERQGANRRRSGRPAKAGVEMAGVGEVLGAVGRCHAKMEEQAAGVGRIAVTQDAIGGQMVKIVEAMEPILKRIAALEVGMRGVREVQTAGASQADDVSAHVFRVEGRVEDTRSCMKVEQTARARVEGELASLQGTSSSGVCFSTACSRDQKKAVS